MLPTVSVVIPTHNKAETLEMVMVALARQTSPADEIICVDDSSEFRQFAEIRKLARCFGASLLRLPDRLTAQGRRSHARHIGTQKANGDVILYLDSDMLIGPRYIESIRQVHAADSRVIVKGVRYSLPVDLQTNSVDTIIDTVFENNLRDHVAEDAYRVSQLHSVDPISHQLTSLAILGAGHTSHLNRLTRRQFFVLAGIAIVATHASGGIQNKKPSGDPVFSPAYSERWDYCASNNLSVRKLEVMAAGSWDTNFVGWGEEDMDFAYRLYCRGCRPILPKDGPIYAYHLDHAVDMELNAFSLRENARYFWRKFPVMASLRRDVYLHYGLDAELAELGLSLE